MINLTITGTLLSTELVNAERQYTKGRFMLTQKDKDDKIINCEVEIRAFNNVYSKDTSAVLRDYLSQIPPGTKLLITGKWFTDIKNKERGVVHTQHIVLNTVIPIHESLDFNSLEIVGRQIKVAEIKYFEKSSKADTSLAINLDKDLSCFYTCQAWGKTATRLSDYSAKGSLIGFEGRLIINAWTGQDGVLKQYLNVLISRIELMGGRTVPHDRQPY